MLTYLRFPAENHKSQPSVERPEVFGFKTGTIWALRGTQNAQPRLELGLFWLEFLNLVGFWRKLLLCVDMTPLCSWYKASLISFFSLLSD